MGVSISPRGVRYNRGIGPMARGGVSVRGREVRMRSVLKGISREHVLATLAYGFFLACTSVTLWGGYLGFPPGIAREGDALAQEFFVRSAALPASLLVSGAAAYLFPKSRRWRSPLVVLAWFVLGGILVALERQIGGVLGGVLLVAGGACFGWASGLMFCVLQEVVASQKVFDAGIIVFAAAGVSALLFFALEFLSKEATPWVALFVLALATVLLARAAQRRASFGHPMFETVPSQRRDRCKESVAELWRPLLCVAFSAFVVGLVRIGSITADGLLGQTNASNMVGLLVASAALLFTWRYLYERVTLTRLYQILFPLTATAFLLIPLLEGSFRQVVVSLVFLVFSVTSSLMVVSCARTARNHSLPPVLVYGLFAGIVYASSLVGSAVGLGVGAGRGAGLAELSVVALVAVYVLSLAMAAPRRGRGRRSPGVETGPRPAVSGGAAGVPETSMEVRCAAAVERYGLSAREAEVLSLLARGRDVPYIAEELVISKNTVRSHAKSIFAKTGVHSRQELIDLVELTEA